MLEKEGKVNWLRRTHYNDSGKGLFWQKVAREKFFLTQDVIRNDLEFTGSNRMRQFKAKIATVAPSNHS